VFGYDFHSEKNILTDNLIFLPGLYGNLSKCGLAE